MCGRVNRGGRLRIECIHAHLLFHRKTFIGIFGGLCVGGRVLGCVSTGGKVIETVLAQTLEDLDLPQKSLHVAYLADAQVLSACCCYRMFYLINVLFLLNYLLKKIQT